MILTDDKVKSILANLSIEIERERPNELIALCPGHELRTGSADNDPSWSINTETGLHHCFSCGYKGNLLTLVAEQKEFYTQWDRLDLEGAKEWLRQNSTIDLPTLIKQMEEIKDSYIAIPKPVPMSEARLALFSNHIPTNALDSRLLTQEACSDFGVLWDKDSARWILPIRSWNEEDHLMGWQEKGFHERYFKNRPTGMAKSKTVFYSNVSRYIQNEYNDMMIVVESPLDAVRLGSMGIPNGVATFGTSVSPEQFAIFRTTKRLIFAFDNDDPGRATSLRMLDLCRKTGVECQFINYDKTNSKDIGEMSDFDIRVALDTAKHCVLGKKAILGE